MNYFRPDGPEWTGADRRSFIMQSLDEIDEGYRIGDATVITQRVLPFYEDQRLIQLSDPRWQPASLRFYYLLSGDKLLRLDGSSNPIHAANEDNAIRLDDGNVVFYLSFFCFFVRGDEGPFLIIDDLENPYLPAFTAGCGEQGADGPGRELCERFRAPRAFGKDTEGNWRWSALVYYSNAIFAADFVISPKGLIEMKNDIPLLTELPARIDAPIAAGND